MEQPALNYFLEGEAPQGTAQRLEEEARKVAQAFKFSEALTSPQPAKAWQVTVYRLLSGAYLVPEFYREHGLEEYLAGVALERLEHLERFTLRPLEFEARKGEDLAAFDTAQQVASAKAFLEEVRAALTAGQFTALCLGDFSSEGQPRFIPGTASPEHCFELDVKGRPWPGEEGEAASRSPRPPAFNPDEVEALLKEVFERAGVYSEGVQVVTAKQLKGYLKAAFRVLVKRGRIAADSQKDFEEFSRAAFPPGISSRALYDEANPAFTLELLALIPKK